MQHPFVSIVSCTYNSEKFLPEMIASVEKQHIDADLFEHIFVDGNSSDGTLELIADYQKRNPSYRIKIVPQQPKGIYNAMNMGIQASHGTYILFLHSDDFLVPQAIPSYLEFVKNTGYRDLYFAQKYNYIQSVQKTSSPQICILPYLGMHKLIL